MRERSDPVIYFIESGRDGPIKVGICNVNAEYRLEQLQVGNPERLRLLMQISGDDALEKQLHRELREHRIRGEWFRNVPEIHAAMARLLAEPGRTEQPMWRRYDMPRHSCSNCGTPDVGKAGDLCEACQEFAAARELAANGVDPFAECVS